MRKFRHVLLPDAYNWLYFSSHISTFLLVFSSFVSRFYNSFLLAHDREIAKEVRVEYINTMSKVYYAYFKAYGGKLTKLQVSH